MNPNPKQTFLTKTFNKHFKQTRKSFKSSRAHISAHKYGAQNQIKFQTSAQLINTRRALALPYTCLAENHVCIIA